MSLEAGGWVYRHSPYTGSTFAVHLAIADSVNDQHGFRLWMSVATLAAKARVERRTAGRCLAQLVADGYLEALGGPKIRGGRPNEYRFVFLDDAAVVYETRANEGATREPTHRVRQEDPPGGSSSRTGCDNVSQGMGRVVAQTQENQNSTQEERNGSDAVGVRADAERLANLLADLIAEDGSLRPNVTSAWVTAIDRMIRLDGRTPEQIENCIRWCQADEFWRSNILSAATLRKKYDQLRKAARRERAAHRPRQGANPADAAILQFNRDYLGEAL